MTDVTQITGQEGDFNVTLNVRPRYVNDKCVACNKCAEVCPVERVNDFNYGLDNNKAAYLPFDMAFPYWYVFDKDVCLGDACKKCEKACEYDAIHLDMTPETVNLNVGAIILSGGWDLYDATKIDNLGFGQVANVVTNMQMERLAAPNGPTGGKILRPSDGMEPKSVAFVQCAGSRDENHLPYCPIRGGFLKRHLFAGSIRSESFILISISAPAVTNNLLKVGSGNGRFRQLRKSARLGDKVELV
jgi:quinone-modifying oxidoreductase subunit QmoA